MMYVVREAKKVLKNHDVLLVTGDGKTLIQDLSWFMDQNIDHDVMCIGRSIQAYPGQVDHYADVDADAGKWVCENLYRNHPEKGEPVRHTLGDVDWFDVGWDIESCLVPSEDVMWHGSTALFCALVGLAMGYHRIVLAGCPLDSKGHWYYAGETRGPVWTTESYQSWLEFAEDDDAHRVRSCSGYTRTILGAPDWYWLNIGKCERNELCGTDS